MPANGYTASSRTLFSPRHNGHQSLDRTPALRAASAGPSAVRPDGLRDSRESHSQTNIVRPVAPVDGKRPALRGWQDKGALGRAPQSTSQPAPGTEGERRAVSDTGSDRSPDNIDDLVD